MVFNHGLINQKRSAAGIIMQVCQITSAQAGQAAPAVKEEIPA